MAKKSIVDSARSSEESASKLKYDERINKISFYLKLLSVETRQKILEHLSDGNSKSPKQIQDDLDIASQPLTRHHLKMFRDEKLGCVAEEGQGKNIRLTLKRRAFQTLLNFFKAIGIKPSMEDESQSLEPAEMAQLTKAMSEPIRVKILMLLSKRELHVNAISKKIGITQPLTSYHLAKLRDRNIVQMRRDGKENYYSIVPETLQPLGYFFRLLSSPSPQD